MAKAWGFYSPHPQIPVSAELLSLPPGLPQTKSQLGVRGSGFTFLPPLIRFLHW